MSLKATAWTSSPGDQHLFGYFEPVGKHPQLLRLEFWRIDGRASFGRAVQSSHILPGSFISGTHAELVWNEKTGNESVVLFEDKSSNGTWVNETHIRRAKVALQHGDRIAFGIPEAESDLLDFRYVFHHVARHPLGDIAAEYTLGDILGEGGFGSVRIGTKKSDGRTKVAIKTIKYLESFKDAQRKTREINPLVELLTLEEISHPNVIEYLGSFHDLNYASIHLVLEFVPGGDLMGWVSRQRATKKQGFAEPFVREIMQQLLSALVHVHGRGITHRDLKPENILMKHSYPGRPCLKVTDFGLARTALNDRPDGHIGTAQFMAPEVFETTGAGYDSISDCFGAGLLMFMVAIAERPWAQPRTPGSSAFPPLKWSEALATLSDPGMDLLQKLLQRDPHKRIPAATALGHEWFALPMARLAPCPCPSLSPV